MEYTIKKFAQLSGVSTRTLRYYDEINLLKPTRINSSGYRIYGQKEVNRLQQILFYREMGLKLEAIRQILDHPDFQFAEALQTHYRELLQKRQQIDALLATVETTLKDYQGGEKMSDQEKFAAFKTQKLAENEAQYGEEIRETYGADTIKVANQKWQQLSEADFQKMNQVETNLFEALTALAESQDIENPHGKVAYQAHKEWLSFTWPKYNPEAHKGLVDMYVTDERFANYYNDKAGKEVVQLLHDVVYRYAN